VQLTLDTARWACGRF